MQNCSRKTAFSYNAVMDVQVTIVNQTAAIRGERGINRGIRRAEIETCWHGL
jgi:hypothetical protein